MAGTHPLNAAAVGALGDVLRARVMLVMGSEQKSASGIARELDVPLKGTNYAVKVLEACGLLEEKERAPVSGSSTYATFYVATAEFDGDLHKIAKRVVAGASS